MPPEVGDYIRAPDGTVDPDAARGRDAAAVGVVSLFLARFAVVTLFVADDAAGVLFARLLAQRAATASAAAGAATLGGRQQGCSSGGCSAPPAPDFGGLSRAAQFGVKPYAELRPLTAGTGLHAHHLIEQRFAGVMGQNPGQMMSVAVTPAEHQAFTNAWRAAIQYGPNGTAVATREGVLQAARSIYAAHPAILQALGL